MHVSTINNFEFFALLEVDGYTVHIPFYLHDLQVLELYGVKHEVEGWILYHKGNRYDGSFEEIEEIYNNLKASLNTPKEAFENI